jgi:hypothetical protein
MWKEALSKADYTAIPDEIKSFQRYLIRFFFRLIFNRDFRTHRCPLV